MGVRDYFDEPKSFILLKNDHRNFQIQIKYSNFGREANLSTKLLSPHAYAQLDFQNFLYPLNFLGNVDSKLWLATLCEFLSMPNIYADMASRIFTPVFGKN